MYMVYFSVNRQKAQIFQEEGNIDHEGKQSIFGQIMQAFKVVDNTMYLEAFRKKSVNDRAYRVDFLGEHSVDEGGPYRDSIVNVVTEMETGLVPLLIASPNNRNEHGANRDCFVLDPTSKSPSHLEMYKFLGGFIAMAILSKAPMPLNLAPSVWK